ncbi:MAG TPA: TolC family protein, partial [Sphingomonadales bacterium]|nr:TolC family protein [Sphingomonadales bacterium]
LRLKKEAAGFEAEAVAWSYQEARLILIRDTKSEWWQAFYLDRALEILDRNLDLLRGLVEIAGKKYEVGKGLQSDVVLAQLELSKLLDVELRLKSARAASGARLGALLAFPAGSAIRIAGEVSRDLPELSGEAALLELAEQNSPRLAVQENRLNAAEAREDYAERDFYPDFTLSADYGFRKGFDQARNLERADFVSFGIGIKIPLYAGSKQSKALDQRRAERQEKTLSLTQTRLIIQRDIGTGLALYRQTREQVRLFGTGIIPQAQMTLDAMRAAYLVDEVDFLNLVSAEITLFNYETRYWQVLSEANQALALIEAAVGKELTNDHQ